MTLSHNNFEILKTVQKLILKILFSSNNFNLCGSLFTRDFKAHTFLVLPKMSKKVYKFFQNSTANDADIL